MVRNHSITSQSPQETQNVGEGIANLLSPPAVVALHGPLGSGKTTFARGFARGLELHTRLLSPTFIIVRRYQLSEPFSFFYHIDLYRIKEHLDPKSLGFDEIFADPRAVVLIEWAEYLGDILPKRRIDVTFAIHEDARTIKIKDSR